MQLLKVSSVFLLTASLGFANPVPVRNTNDIDNLDTYSNHRQRRDVNILPRRDDGGSPGNYGPPVNGGSRGSAGPPDTTTGGGPPSNGGSRGNTGPPDTTGQRGSAGPPDNAGPPGNSERPPFSQGGSERGNSEYAQKSEGTERQPPLEPAVSIPQRPSEQQRPSQQSSDSFSSGGDVGGFGQRID